MATRVNKVQYVTFLARLGQLGLRPGSHARQALMATAEMVLSEWREKIIRAHPNSDRIRDSLRIVETDQGFEIVSDWPVTWMLEDGTGPRDMKKMLQTSPKARTNRAGRPYMRIPMDRGRPEPTIVTMTADSEGWIHPGVHGGHQLDTTLDEMESKIADMVADGLTQDIQEALQS